MNILEYVNEKFQDIDDRLKEKVSLDRFTPVERIVYGGAGLILVGFITWLISLAFNKPKIP